MKRTFFMFFCVFLSTASTNAAAGSLILNRADSVTPVVIDVGTAVQIRLDENPTTGYQWTFYLTPEKQTVLTDIQEDFIAPNTSLVGAGGIKEYRFKAARTGTVRVTGYYFRPWEKLNRKTDDSVTFDITVK